MADAAEQNYENIPKKALWEWIFGTWGLPVLWAFSRLHARQCIEDDDRPIWEVFADTMKDAPREELAALPKDGAAQDDHYLYRHPKT